MDCEKCAQNKKYKNNLPSRFVLCGNTVILLTAANSWSRTGCDLAPHESEATQMKWPVLFARMLACSNFLYQWDNTSVKQKRYVIYNNSKRIWNWSQSGKNEINSQTKTSDVHTLRRDGKDGWMEETGCEMKFVNGFGGNGKFIEQNHLK